MPSHIASADWRSISCGCAPLKQVPIKLRRSDQDCFVVEPVLGRRMAPTRGLLTRNKIVHRGRYGKTCPGGSRGLPFERSAGGSVDPGLRRESAPMAVSFRVGRPPAGGELAMTNVVIASEAKQSRRRMFQLDRKLALNVHWHSDSLRLVMGRAAGRCVRGLALRWQGWAARARRAG
jgi:hypothetical protein